MRPSSRELAWDSRGRRRPLSDPPQEIAPASMAREWWVRTESHRGVGVQLPLRERDECKRTTLAPAQATRSAIECRQQIRGQEEDTVPAARVSSAAISEFAGPEPVRC